ncbi:hypothetical protein ACWKST_09070 [Limosilactobacillus reuteri]
MLSLSSALNVDVSALLKGSGAPSSRRRKHVDLLSWQLYKLPEDEAERLSIAFLQVVKAIRNNKNE